MHCGKLGTIWKRWYNTSVRGGFFGHTRTRAGGLLLSSRHDNVARTLWRYFNAPGNIMFVTCNLVTFAGFVTMNSLVTFNREHLAETKLLEAENSLDVQDDWELPKEPGSPLDEIPANKMASQPKASPQLATYNSQMAKMSIFHMVYAFYLCKHVLVDDSSSNAPEAWREEVKLLGGDFVGSKHNYSEMGRFYSEWKEHFLDVFTDLNKSQQFHFPSWQNYPGPLGDVCKKLYNNQMENIHDFEQFYNKVKSKEVRKLLRLWLFDYTHFFSPIDHFSAERFYRELIRQCQDDDVAFVKYSSILLNPLNPRRNTFFPKYGSSPVQSASIDTVLEVLRGYIHLRETQGKRHYGAIIRLISMLKKDCIVVKCKSTANHASVRVMLPTDEQREFVELHTTSEQRKKSFALVARNQEAIRLLDSISKWSQKTK